MAGTETQRVPARAEVPAEYTWDLTTVYATDTAWGEGVAWIEATLPQIAALQGTLGQGASSLVRALRLRDVQPYSVSTSNIQEIGALHTMVGRRRHRL